jgi:hypothetical protein
MTVLLEKAVDEVAALPDDQQDMFARWMLEELASERRWDQAFAGTADSLARLAQAALDDDAAGLTVVLDPETM